MRARFNLLRTTRGMRAHQPQVTAADERGLSQQVQSPSMVNVASGAGAGLKALMGMRR